MDSGPIVPLNGQIITAHQSSFSDEFNRNAAPGAYPRALVQDSLLREYMRVLIKSKWVIVASVALVVGIVTISTLRSTPIYEAVGSIAINKMDPVSFNLKDSSSGFDYYDPTDLDTEVRILKSDLLALQVIRQLNLDRQPEFAGKGKPSGPSSLDLTTDALQPDSARTSAALANFKGSLQVSLIPNTRIIEIHYRSPDKNIAARVVNTLANTYVEQNFKTRFESTMQASDWLSKQLVDLQIKVETSQEKLVQYQKQHEILGIDEKQNITTAKLDELNRELTSAESTRMEKESIYHLVQPGDSDSVAAAANVDGAAKGSSASSALLEKLREQQADLKIQVAQMSTQFGPSYPKLAQLNSQLKEVDEQIQTETRKVAARLRGDYLAAVQRESLLRTALEQQKQEANKLNESAIEYSLLKRDVDANRTLSEGLLEKLKEAGVTAGLRSNNFRIVDVARVPTSPSGPNILRNVALALALGLSTGIGLAFLLDSMDNTVRTPEQAQVISALPSLGMIPLGSRSSREFGSRQKLSLASSKEAVELVTQSRPRSQMAESYRALRTSLLLTFAGGPPKVILITSALPEEGKTTTSVNSAIVLAQKGTRVLLIDADLRRPSIHKTLGMGPKIGLSNVLTGNATLQQAIIPSTVLPDLFVLPAGTPPPNPAELLASNKMKNVLEELRKQYDHIVIDSPPTLSVTDAVVMSTSADAVVLVIRSGHTTKPALRRARDILLQVNARVCGVLVNAVDLSSPDYYYHYEYQGKYGTGTIKRTHGARKMPLLRSPLPERSVDEHLGTARAHENPCIKISLRSPARKIIFLGTCLLFSTFCIGLASREFFADYFSKRLDLPSLQMAARLEPENADYQYRLGHYFLETQHEPEMAVRFVKSATTLNPHNAAYWLELSRIYQRLADGDQQKDALQHAIAADPSTPDVAWDAANFYWTLGETDRALGEFRAVLENDPYLPPEALDRCWRIKPDVDFLLRDVVPRKAEVYSSFLDLLVSKNEPVAAARVWTQMVQLQRAVEPRYVFNYVRYLIENRDIAQAHQAWGQAARLCDLSGYQPSPENLVVNGDFSLPVLNGGFDWLYEKRSDVSLTLDPSESHSGHRSLSIIFDSRGIEDTGIRQLIPVEPDTKYEFSAYFKSEGLEGAGGPRFLVQDRFTGADYFASEELKDEGFWKQVEGTFDTGPETKLLVLRIQRVPAGNAIRGKLWIGDVRLAPVHLTQEQSAAGGQ